MEQRPTFANNNDNVVDELQGVEDIDHAIMTVTEVARRLSQQNASVESNDYKPDPRVAEEGLSVRTDGCECI